MKLRQLSRNHDALSCPAWLIAACASGQGKTTVTAAFECVPYRYGKGEKVYRRGAVTASYLHAYFPSNPAAAAGLLFPTA